MDKEGYYCEYFQIYYWYEEDQAGKVTPSRGKIDMSSALTRAEVFECADGREPEGSEGSEIGGDANICSTGHGSGCESGYGSGYESGYGDDFRVGAGRSYATGRGGSVEAEGGRGLNFNWWHHATGGGGMCPRELSDRLDEAVDKGEAEAMSDGSSSDCSSSDEEGFFGRSTKRGHGEMGFMEPSGKRRSMSPGTSALVSALFQ